MIQQAVGFLGAGNMAEALIRGLLETGVCTPDKLAVSDVNEIRLAHMAKTFGLAIFTGNVELVRACPVLVLAVKPPNVAEVLKDIRPALQDQQHVLISMAAGISTRFIEKKLRKQIKVVRVMPNTPARLLSGATGFCLGQFAGETESLLTHLIFDAVGITVRVEESLMNAVTALSGSGPAYVFKLCEMMTAGGVDMGLPIEAAEKLALQTVWGAARMLRESGETPASLRTAVTSPGGTTQAALDMLAKADFDQVFSRALRAARDRGQKLSAERDGD